jgi:nitrile hydratase accessory protein
MIHPPDPPAAAFPQTDHEPVFNAPWEARAFAMVNQLAADHHCTWAEWTEYLVSVMAEAASSEATTDYQHWVLACEKLLADKGLLAAQAIDQRIDALIAEREAEH